MSFFPKLAFLKSKSLTAKQLTNTRLPTDGRDTGTEPIANSIVQNHSGTVGNTNKVKAISVAISEESISVAHIRFPTLSINRITFQ